MAFRPTDRRANCAEELARALLHSSEPMTFDQLADRAAPAPVGDVAAWIGHAVAAGLIEEVGAERLTQRRFRLRPRGADVLTSARRDSDSQTAAA